jgi:hypothetical protein
MVIDYWNINLKRSLRSKWVEWSLLQAGGWKAEDSDKFDIADKLREVLVGGKIQSNDGKINLGNGYINLIDS